ncbi:PKS-ER domain-containing protein [Mycena indigotica]|uniref:PKS-ER domain-containing protein n=1 Tax=Mycena indigotica TaxID=2126181 RepID=A0A8H6WH23_9AGAR|nr:PKS-ER domain-containing protein [Mycena indigotica]KAF7312054.1 PKS-ER domain-containing protein [Mycena indigotica]
MRAVMCPRAPIEARELVYSTDHPAPQPKDGHVLIRVKAFGLNRAELYARKGQLPGLSFPRIPGNEAVGIVQHAGGGLWKEGDVVAAMMGGMGVQFDGSYSEYTLVPHQFVSAAIKLPANVSWAQFAAIPVTFLTAWGILKSALKLEAGESLLIRGGSSSLGLALAALATSKSPHFGFSASSVISSTRTEAKATILKESGAHHAVVDPPTGNISETVKKLSPNEMGVNKAVELVGPPVLADTMAALTPNGVVAMVGTLSNVWSMEFRPWALLMPAKHITTFSGRSINLSTAPLQAIVDAVGSGELKLNVDKVFGIAETVDAHTYMESNAAAGKVVCLVD